MLDTSSSSGCQGCGVILPDIDGPTHRYMGSSPACFALFTKLLAAEYSDPALLATHRLTVDTYAVQHPGQGRSRQEIQSVGLHLARLFLQLEHPRPPQETNDVMVGLGRHKHSLDFLDAPKQFSQTVEGPAMVAGQLEHPKRVQSWAAATWLDWEAHHDYIYKWVGEVL